MSLAIDPNKIRIGDIVLIDTGTQITHIVQERLGYGNASHWTHIAGSIGGFDLIEGTVPRARVAHLQNDYVSKGIQIKVMRKAWADESDRIKVALWWATMNNLPYDFTGLLWVGISSVVSNWLLRIKNWFKGGGKEFCSELLADGFLKQGYNLFNKPAADVLPADFDDPKLFQEITDVWDSIR